MEILDPVKLSILTITETSVGCGHLGLLPTHQNNVQGACTGFYHPMGTKFDSRSMGLPWHLLQLNASISANPRDFKRPASPRGFKDFQTE